MATLHDRAYLSIGEVLTLLQDEFPDVTISKIRFLESQGLIDPERTPSGYRKFYDGDVERLRFILREQKDHFLPLKVIKDRLAGGEPAGQAGESAPAATPAPAPAATAPANTAATTPATVPPGAATDAGAPEREPSWMARAREKAANGRADTVAPERPEGGDALTADQLCATTGLSRRELSEVERYGLLQGRAVGSTTYYDTEAVTCASLVAVFLRHGVEPRHLRLYRNAVDREAALFEQVVLPLVKQRNPQARTQAATTLLDLTQHGAELREALLRQSLRPYLEG